LQELHRPTCPTSVTLHHLLECALCAQLTPGHVYLVVHTMVTAFSVLPLPVLVCGTVCRCGFENRIFRSTILNCVEDVFVLGEYNHSEGCTLQVNVIHDIITIIA